MDTKTNTSTPEKQNNLEQQFLAETGTELSELENLKISEAVGETVGENFSEGIKTTQASAQKRTDPKSLISTNRARKIILPTIARQKAKVQHAIEQEQKHLLKKARKMQDSRKFSAAALEDTYRAIRKLQSLLDELLRAAGKRITELYHRYVLRNG